MAIKILHTADVHIGAKLTFLGERAEEQRKQINATFSATCALGAKQKADLLLIAGDLFDSPYPSAANVLFVQDCLQKLNARGIYVVIIPGNHDLLEAGSIFARDSFRQSDKLKIFKSGEIEAWSIPALDLVVYGRATLQRKSKSSPLAGLKLQHTAKFHVGVFHGSVELLPEVDNLPIKKEEIGASGLSYLALGDWHSTLDVSQGKTKAFYSGAPELVATTQFGAGNAVMVELGEKGCSADKVAVGKRKAVKLEVDLAKFKDTASLSSELNKRSDADTFLSITLNGNRQLESDFDVSSLQEFLSQHNFFVHITDNSQLALQDKDLKAFPPETVIGRFILNLQKRKGKDVAENAIIDEAIQLGVKLLRDED